MEIKLKKWLHGNDPLGIINGIEGFFKRSTKFSIKASEAVGVNLTSYQASEESVNQVMEIDRQRTQALIEAQRMRNRMNY